MLRTYYELSKAVARAAERLDISRSPLPKVLGISPATITRLYSGNYQLDQGRKEWGFAPLFVRAFRSLDWWLAAHRDEVIWRRDHEFMTFSTAAWWQRTEADQNRL